MAKILVLHGPNLNLLGLREPGIYGHETLAEINERLVVLGQQLQHEVITFQSNHEGALIDYLQQTTVDFILFNPAAYTHTSIALRDCLLAIKIPFIEVHLSDIHQRETFRHHSYFTDIAYAAITGLGARSYEVALKSADSYFKRIVG